MSRAQPSTDAQHRVFEFTQNRHQSTRNDPRPSFFFISSFFSPFFLFFFSLSFFCSFVSWSSLSEIYIYDTIHVKWKWMAKNTADLRDEIKRGRSLLNNLKSLFIFLFLSFSLFLTFILSSVLSETFLSLSLLFIAGFSILSDFRRTFPRPGRGKQRVDNRVHRNVFQLRSRSILLISPVGNYSIYSSSDFVPFRSSSLASP